MLFSLGEAILTTLTSHVELQDAFQSIVIGTTSEEDAGYWQSAVSDKVMLI
jgi:hypothetical protein